MPIVRARLLGRFVVRVGPSGPTSLGSARAESLLAFLLLHRGEPQSRQRLAGLLWPDSDEVQARTNLRHLLHTLRRDLPGVDDQHGDRRSDAALGAEPTVELDVAAFEGWLDAAAANAAERREALRSAVALYRGDLLERCDDEWLRDSSGRNDRVESPHRRWLILYHRPFERYA